MIPILVVIFHFVFDWLLQTRSMAKNKSRRLDVLFAHLFILSVGCIILSLILIKIGHQIEYWKVAINIASHGVIDWYIWRLFKTIKMHKMRDEADWDLFVLTIASDPLFFHFIAIDQCLHLVIAMWAFNA